MPFQFLTSMLQTQVYKSLNHTLIGGEFDTPISSKIKLFRQKLNKVIPKLTDVVNQKDLTDIYRTFHPNKKQCTFFASHVSFSKTEHTLGYKQVSTDARKLK